MEEKRDRESAELGYAPAQLYLGICYANGSGVPRDDALAVTWVHRAADQRDRAAQVYLDPDQYTLVVVGP